MLFFEYKSCTYIILLQKQIRFEIVRADCRINYIYILYPILYYNVLCTSSINKVKCLANSIII